MEIIYLVTHMMMAICMVIIFYWSFKPYEAVYDKQKIPLIARFYTRGLKLVQVTAFATCRIVVNILIVYLK
ncbi:MAG: hypothetical protein JWP37_2609 [Mucilaginibacter sp.]|nr:hypothetical protein [Mucilaginibacter sp.]